MLTLSRPMKVLIQALPQVIMQLNKLLVPSVQAQLQPQLQLQQLLQQ
jgi:hypothetical protein